MTSRSEVVLVLGEQILNALNTDRLEQIGSNTGHYLQMLDELFTDRDMELSLSPDLTIVLQQYAQIIERVRMMRNATASELQRVTQLDRVASFYRTHSG